MAGNTKAVFGLVGFPYFLLYPKYPLHPLLSCISLVRGPSYLSKRGSQRSKTLVVRKRPLSSRRTWIRYCTVNSCVSGLAAFLREGCSPFDRESSTPESSALDDLFFVSMTSVCFITPPSLQGCHSTKLSRSLERAAGTPSQERLVPDMCVGQVI